MNLFNHMPNVIWARPFIGTYTGGDWYNIEPTAKMFVFAEGYGFKPYTKYVKDEQGAEIFAWNQTPLDIPIMRGWFRLERHEAINLTVGYRKV
jgi:hypothetical protein